jgi:hypothetical protein
MTLSVTLDSNVVIDAYESADRDAQKLLKMHPRRAKLAVASRTPFMEARRWQAALLANGITVLPTLMRVGSGVIGVDLIGGGQQEAKLPAIKQALFPDGIDPAQRRFGSKLNDIDIVFGHLLAANDLLVTRDGDILRAQAPLAALGIRVTNIRDCLRLLGWRRRLAEAFRPRS